MEEDKDETQNLIIDTNVIFASLIRSEGLTRAALVLILNNSKLKSFSPESIIQEMAEMDKLPLGCSCSCLGTSCIDVMFWKNATIRSMISKVI